ncbi:MAG: hypothetical protein HC904_01745 [Blastochloris sp.]|nr:hypothetical protein [Blastochloris sp.]
MKLWILGWMILVSGTSLQAGELNVAFEEWKSFMEASAKKLNIELVMKFEPEKKVLVVGQEFKLNELRKQTLLQMVPVPQLQAEVELEGVSKLKEPWLKLRCLEGRPRVNIEKRTYIEGAQVEEVAQEVAKAFLVIPCHRQDLKRGKELAERFLSLAGAK